MKSVDDILAAIVKLSSRPNIIGYNQWTIAGRNLRFVSLVLAYGTTYKSYRIVPINYRWKKCEKLPMHFISQLCASVHGMDQWNPTKAEWTSGFSIYPRASVTNHPPFSFIDWTLWHHHSQYPKTHQNVGFGTNSTTNHINHTNINTLFALLPQ